MSNVMLSVECDSDDCIWNRDGRCARASVKLQEYKIRNRMGDRIAVICTHRMVRR